MKKVDWVTVFLFWVCEAYFDNYTATFFNQQDCEAYSHYAAQNGVQGSCHVKF